MLLDKRDKSDYNNRTWQIYFEGQRDIPSCTTYHWDSSKEVESYRSLKKPEEFQLDSVVYLGAPINNCGINTFADATHIIYNTTVIVTYGQNPNDFIHREEYEKYNVMCTRNRTVEANDNFQVQFKQTVKDAKSRLSSYMK